MREPRHERHITLIGGRYLATCSCGWSARATSATEYAAHAEHEDHVLATPQPERY